MFQCITKAFVLLSIMLITMSGEAADKKPEKNRSNQSEYSVTVPLCSDGSLSEMKWRKGSPSLNQNAFLFDQQRGDEYWHAIINNTAKGTWRNFNNSDAKTAIRQLLGDDADQLSDLSVVQVTYHKEVATDGESAKLTFTSAKIYKKETAAIELLHEKVKS
ncbi:MAG: hypothetical protein D8M57_11260 [Candidatus Scalindua sp. AMX11]|nr:MAG: hypothetical protein DWQ00_06785 [Candidatus Scalindua sp.]NOG83463.1 hypothetical protein [Planctomycetota bacterium]RZV72921.1 MAG: hypothetical protein EX341_13945 [Candidatus Scalindua sp. SCAELEC01]TDE64782.1 MAG: hypothetical protein D8M57_11260 [Candidatus Scalindua sp. AMX11]GJQ59836.1 MAG: hypothetical protein SCALA701_26370 [Candidatus Scalindua sp.]